MRREILRQQWEIEEETLRNKSDIHYQDILFNEARSHGVGYYGFSKDEEERAKQQEELRKLRKETENKQEVLKQQKTQREKILAARLKAARNRKRARMGLEPEEDDPEPIPSEEPPKIDEAEEKRKAEAEEEEKRKELMRKQDVRPWDVGKEGVKGVVKKHYELSQEEWVDKKRAERPDDFAPPSAYARSSGRTEFRSAAPKYDLSTEPLQKTLYFSSKKSTSKTKPPGPETVQLLNIRNFNPAVPPPNYTNAKETTAPLNPYKRKNYVSQMPPVPIENECVDFDEEQERECEKPTDDSSSSEEETPARRTGAQIPPPPTFEYYGPGDSKKTKVSNEKGDIADSISAGLKFLRDQAEKKNIANQKRVIYEH